MVMFIFPLLLAVATGAAAPPTIEPAFQTRVASTDSAVIRTAGELLSARDRGDWGRYVDLLSTDAVREIQVQLLRMVDPAEGGVSPSDLFGLSGTETLESLPERDQVIRGLRRLIEPREDTRWIMLPPEVQSDGSIQIRAQRDGGVSSVVSVLHFIRVQDTWRAKSPDDHVRGAIAGALAARSGLM